jgi:hypothetical protein
MTREYSNEEFGFNSSAYAEPAAKREEDKIAKSPSAPAKIKVAAETAVAPAVEAASATAPVAVAPPLPALPAASAGAPPAIENPAQSLDFWSSALKGVGIPAAVGLGAGALGNAIFKNRQGDGQGVQATPAVDEELRQLRLAQEQAKLDLIKSKIKAPATPAPEVPAAPSTPVAESGLPATGQQFSVQEKPVDYSLTPAKSYGQQNLNAPTGAPNVAVAPPAAAPVAPVEPKPMSELEQLRLQKAQFELDAARAREARAAELHANRLAAEAKRGEVSSQKKTSSGINPQDRQMLESSEKAKFDKAIAADQKAAAVIKAPAPVATPATVAAPAAEVAAVPKAAVPPTTAKWPGGAEGSALQLFGGTKKNLTPESMAALELFKGDVGPLTMPPTGGTIHQIEQASQFYEKHTGQPLPRNAEGKLTRIPEEQMQKLHAGIRTELEDAVKGNKLGSLGKGAMAAAALLGLTGAVQAAQKGDFGPLRQAGFDIGGPVALGKLGIAALSRAAGTGFSAATYAGGLNEGEDRELARRRHEFEKESQKLGSPLRSVPPPKK